MNKNLYIRTKDGIYKVRKPFIEEYLYKDAYYVYRHEAIKKKDIVSKADTIKELCDEFVVAYEDGARIVYGDLEWAKTKAKTSLELGNKSIIYGAIWTDKGLIYVAKMNDEGELELI